MTENRRCDGRLLSPCFLGIQKGASCRQARRGRRTGCAMAVSRHPDASNSGGGPIASRRGKAGEQARQRPENKQIREIAIPVEQMITMEKDNDVVFVSWNGGQRFMFVKCGGRFGKVSICRVYSGERNVSTGYGELGENFDPHFFFNLFLNKNPGDTNLTCY